MKSGPYLVSRDEIIEFAEEFDPQPLHLDEVAAKTGLYGGIIASGWHTCSIFMRMMVDAFLHKTLSQGSPGVDQVRWKKPVYPGDTLTGESTVISSSISRSRPNLGFVQFHHEIFNQDGDVVITIKNAGMVEIRNPTTKGVEL